MELFEKIGDAASKTYKFTAEKTSKIAKETKTKMQINEHKSNIKEKYMEIGEAVYGRYVRDEDIDLDEIKEKCKEIQELSDKIAGCKDEILNLKEKKQCKNCYEEIDVSAKYCPNCGMIQEEIATKEEEKDNEEHCEHCDNCDNCNEEE